jgi:hypothetical protein
MQPSEFWRLSLSETAELARWMNEYVTRQNRAEKG